jgi:hypothetical protein
MIKENGKKWEKQTLLLLFLPHKKFHSKTHHFKAEVFHGFLYFRQGFSDLDMLRTVFFAFPAFFTAACVSRLS